MTFFRSCVQILAYNRANRAVAILCNHQRAVPKTFDKSMENLMKKIADKKEVLEEAEKAYKVCAAAALLTVDIW